MLLASLAFGRDRLEIIIRLSHADVGPIRLITSCKQKAPRLGCCDGRMVCVLAIDIEGPSLNPAGAYLQFLYSKSCQKKNKIRRKGLPILFKKLHGVSVTSKKMPNVYKVAQK